MHMLIRGLVREENAADALDRAKADVFDPLVRRGVFDYYRTADMDGQGVAGTDRWGEYPTAVPARSQPGEDLIDSAWDATVEHYERSMDYVQEFFDDCDPSDLWEDLETGQEYRYHFDQLGRQAGDPIYLYTTGGTGIRSKPDLDSLYSLTSYVYGRGREPVGEKQLYVVPADVHY